MTIGGRAPLVVVTDNRFGELGLERSVLEPAGCAVVEAACATEAEVAAAGRGADALLVNLAPVGAAAIRTLDRCAVLSRYGVGLDNIDLEAAAAAGIAVRNVPGYCDEEVSDHALALALDLLRSTTLRDRAVRSGTWNFRPPTPRVSSSTIGILGFGGAARALARKAVGIGFGRVLVWSRGISPERIAAAFAGRLAPGAPRVEASGFRELLAASDLVSVHLALTEDTRNLLDAEAFSCMKPGARLVNTARGGLVDEDALLAALDSGLLAAAALDVFAVEPLPPDHPFRSRRNLVLSDHAAWHSDDSVRELRLAAAGNVLAVLRERADPA